MFPNISLIWLRTFLEPGSSVSSGRFHFQFYRNVFSTTVCSPNERGKILRRLIDLSLKSSLQLLDKIIIMHSGKVPQ